MRNAFEKALSVIMAVLLAFGAAPALADEITNDEFFPDIVIEDKNGNLVTYYDTLGSIESHIDVGMQSFVETYLTTSRGSLHGSEMYSLFQRWGQVAEAIINAADEEDGTIPGEVKASWAFKSTERKYDSGIGRANSVRQALEGARFAALNSSPRHNVNNFSAYRTVPDDKLPSDASNSSFYFWRRADPKTGMATSPLIYYSIVNDINIFRLQGGENVVQ